MRIGLHVSIAGGLSFSVERAAVRGCEAMQIFSGNPRNWRPWEVSGDEIAAFQEARQAAGIHPLVVHAPYLVNPASPNREIRAKSLAGTIQAVIMADRVGADAFVVHSGSGGPQAGRDALDLAAAFAYIVLEEAEPRLRFLLENTAGGGGQVGSSFEQLAKIIQLAGASPDRLGICFDTAHAFAAGYDLAGESGIERVLERLDETVGLDRVGCIHANDNKFELGAGRDRHDHIGEGFIGLEGFRALALSPLLRHLPFILETPGGEDDDARNVRCLKDLRASGTT
ncbi:MAG: deoxyribonuclease IV [Candidatus Aquicultorales bacterium]